MPNDHIFIITRACGVGKTSIFPYIKENLPEFQVHDFDEVGVPSLPTVLWRKDTTRYWIDLAVEKLKSKRSTIILGMIVPQEVREYVPDRIKDKQRFLLLDVTTEERNRRFQCRNEQREFLLTERKKSR